MKKTDIWKKEREFVIKQNERDEMRKDIKRQFELLHNRVTELEKTLEKYKELECELLTGWSIMAYDVSVHGVENDYIPANKENVTTK